MSINNIIYRLKVKKPPLPNGIRRLSEIKFVNLFFYCFNAVIVSVSSYYANKVHA